VLPLNHRQHVDADGTLSVSAVNRLSDAGLYTCDARGSNGQRDTRSVYVSIMGTLLSYCQHASSLQSVCS